MAKKKVLREPKTEVILGPPIGEWIDNELSGCSFKDTRLGKRFRSLLAQLSSGPGESIPLVCQDWANTKAAYRFLANDRVSEVDILAGHFGATRARFAASEGPTLVLHDTTEFSYKREDIEAVGITRKGVAGATSDGRPRHYTACGILMHSSLVVTTDGLPLGIAAIKFWTRQKFKGTNALKKKINPTRVPIEAKESIRWLDNLMQSTALLAEPQRCVHVGDRESDIYELFCAAQEAGTHFLLRTCVDRLAGDGAHTIAAEMDEVRCKGLHRVEVRDRQGKLSEAVLELKYRRIRVRPPIGKQRRYCDQDGAALDRIGEVISEQLDIVPATIRVQYACRCGQCIKTAPLPAQPIPKSMASPGLLAHITVSKYQDALPLYRQEQILTRIGVDIPRATLANWMIQAGALIQPLINSQRSSPRA